MRVTRVTNQVGALAARAARLRVLAGPDAGLEIDLPPVGVVIGADRGCDVALTDPSVSSRHCTVSPTAAGFAVADLGSRNGTSIDGVAVQKVVAPPGVILRLGHSLLQLLPADDVVAIPPSGRDHLGALWGDSPGMRTVFAILERAARTDASILFLGESGTGKELAARAVHDESPRRGGPFVVFDCGAATETLVESDLFGHVKGAFTGAAADRQGAFAAADGGTLFLDEIGDVSAGIQVKLLRVLQEGEFERVGGTRTMKADVRLVTATNADLEKGVREGRIREDFYYRIKGVTLRVPPLRERREDIPLLAEHFVARACVEAKRPPMRIDPAAVEVLKRHPWPGNVRQLESGLRTAVVLAKPSQKALTAELLPAEISAGAGTADLVTVPAGMKLADVERLLIEKTLAREGGSKAKAAKVLGIGVRTLYRKMEEYRIQEREGKEGKGA